MNQKCIFLLLLLCASVFLYAQEKSPAKFGKINVDNFATKIYDIDTSANAVVLADIGSTDIVGDSKGNFVLEFKRFRRIHILNKNGYDAVNVEIGLYTSNDKEEVLDNLKAVTYNLEGNKVIETKLESKSIFKDKHSKNLVVKKFTFPNVKEGSIIEYEYKIKSDFIFNLQPWVFQGSYPTLWSEYNVALPAFYYYVMLTQGYLPYHINSSKEKENYYSIQNNQDSRFIEIKAIVTYNRWVIKDAPALKEEVYTSSIKNHLSRIEFQLAEIREPFTPRSVLGNWKEATQSLLKDENFGLELSKDDGWLNDAMKVAATNSTDLDKAKSIYYYIQNNISCTNYNRIYCDNSLKSVLKNGKGNEAEINLLLIAMLRKAKIVADPVILSTRSHGYAVADYPLMDKLNYVIVRAKINDSYYYLDASQGMMGFGKLSSETYNGYARVISETSLPVDLNSDLIQESKVTSVSITHDKKKNVMSGIFQQAPGYYESTRLRKSYKENGMETFFKEYARFADADTKVSEARLDFLDEYEKVIGLKFNIEIKTNDEDIVYFNPMMLEAWKENPFKSAERFYPVELPYKIDEMYLFKMDIPDGYVVDELPKSIKVKLSHQNTGNFEFVVSETGNVISIQSRISILKTFFQPTEYDNLREFFNQIVKKHSEQIVFKKKK